MQKYEQGANRISARTIYTLREHFNVRYEDFFNPLSGKSTSITDAEHEKIIIHIIRYCMAIRSINRKRTILSLIKSLADEEDQNLD